MADVRLIEANELLKKKECCGRISGDDVRNAPTINPEDCRPQGRWKIKLDDYCLYCTAGERPKKIAGIASWTGLTPKWCPKLEDKKYDG